MNKYTKHKWLIQVMNGFIRYTYEKKKRIEKANPLSDRGFERLQQVFQKQQQYHTGSTESTNDNGVEPVDSQRQAHNVACKIQEKQCDKANQTVDEKLAHEANGGGQQLVDKCRGNDCQNNDTNEFQICTVPFMSAQML